MPILWNLPPLINDFPQQVATKILNQTFQIILLCNIILVRVIMLNKNSFLGKIANSRGLKIASLNINSLLAHIDELRAYMTSGPIDILAIN